MVADQDNIAYTITGTHQGPFQGIPATGKKIKARGMQTAKFDASARIKDRWGSSDELAILQQIGAAKSSQETPAISAAEA
jgi:predicted ester cyclase